MAERDAARGQMLLGDLVDAVRRRAVVDHLRLGPGVGVLGGGRAGKNGMFVGLLVASSGHRLFGNGALEPDRGREPLAQVPVGLPVAVLRHGF